MRFNVTRIEVEFDKNSFSEWANATEEQNPTDVARWETAYYNEIEQEIKDVYPNAEVEVKENYYQVGKTNIYTGIETVESEESDYEVSDSDQWAIDHAEYDIDEKVTDEVNAIIDRVSDRGNFWG